jgi:hypothetical protein
MNTITAYNEDWKPYNSTREEYIKLTTIASEPNNVKDKINEYIKENDCNEDIVQCLNKIVNNETLLNKTNIVWDGSYRNCSLLVRPDGFIDTSEISHESIVNLDSALEFYTQYAETFFLLLDEETWEEINERDFMMESEEERNSYYLD